jgi:hypothetical protein
MLIYGSKATQIASKSLSDKCTNCGAENSVQMAVFQKYAHVFWIPFFPIGKTGVTQCAHCKQVLEKKEFSSSLLSTYETLISDSKTPRWTFSGLAVLTLLIILVSISNAQNDKKNAQLILAPKKGDIYEIRNDYEHYTLYKIDHVAGDTVFILMNEYESNKVTGLNTLKGKGDAAFVDTPIPLFKSDLKSMFDAGKIMNIDRKQ